jgi:hypothetical protein
MAVGSASDQRLSSHNTCGRTLVDCSPSLNMEMSYTKTKPFRDLFLWCILVSSVAMVSSISESYSVVQLDHEEYFSKRHMIAMPLFIPYSICKRRLA